MKKQTTKKKQRSTRTKSTRPDNTSAANMVRTLPPNKNRKSASSPFAKPSKKAIARYCNIPLLFEGSLEAHSVFGKTVYDSWADMPAIALRDSANGRIRQLKLKAGDLVLEIVAEYLDNVWEFVARVYDCRKVTNDFVLKVGNRRFLPQTGGFFVWSSRLVPRVLRLESFETNISFEKLSWQ